VVSGIIGEYYAYCFYSIGPLLVVLKNPDIAVNSQRYWGKPREISTNRESPRSVVKSVMILHENPPVQNMRWRILKHTTRPQTFTSRIKVVHFSEARAEDPGVIQFFEQFPGSFLADGSRVIVLVCQWNGCLSTHVN